MSLVDCELHGYVSEAHCWSCGHSASSHDVTTGAITPGRRHAYACSYCPCRQAFSFCQEPVSEVLTGC